MIILIQNLPENVTKEDISKFVTPALKKLGIIRLGNIQKIDTLSVVNKDSRSVQYASLVRINTEMPIQIIIDKLNGKRFKSEIVEAREYKIRTVHNDPRFRYPRGAINNKRIVDRRLSSDIELCAISELPKLLSDLQPPPSILKKEERIRVLS